MYFDNFFVIKYSYYNHFWVKNQAFSLLYLKKMKNQDPAANFFITTLQFYQQFLVARLRSCVDICEWFLCFRDP